MTTVLATNSQCRRSHAVPDNEAVKEPLYPPLLSALNRFRRVSISAGALLFHGGRTKSPHADFRTHKLTGTRKWFSEDATYAVSYSFVDSDEYGTPLLWVCRARNDIVALHGSQYELLKSQPWGEAAFPWAFPSRFADYAGAVLGGTGPYALLDLHDGARYQEILVTSPEDAIHVIDAVELPRAKSAAEEFARERFGLRA
jgi:hypothetical protein